MITIRVLLTFPFLCCFAWAGALEDYVARPDASFRWTMRQTTNESAFSVHRLELISQTWRSNVWTHSLVIVRPSKIVHDDIAFLFVTGDGDGSRDIPLLKILAERAGAIAAVVTRVPNQPLYGGRKEDALIAYTFHQYIDTHDPTWPLLFPMAKSAVRALDAVQEFMHRETSARIERFVVSGASKRGWTTWLTGAVDPRVVAIAPMVIDMLNMKVQTDWSQKVYGRQSEQIKDYEEHDLIQQMDTAPMRQLREWVDPYSYRNRYKMPKLLLLGTNDPYWTVDSLRHYWNDLPDPKWVFETVNAGHDLAGGSQATPALAAFYRAIATHKELPRLSWNFQTTDAGVRLTAKATGKVEKFSLWTARSTDRDFRDDRWTSSDQLKVKADETGTTAVAEIPKPGAGYTAYLIQAELVDPTGHRYKLSTEARVVPDDLK